MITFSSFGFLCRLMILIADFTNVGSLNCRQQSLLWHNHYRRIHQVGDVTWSFGLMRKARTWAIHLAKNNLFIHEKKDQGNLFLSPGKPREPCAAAVKLFYTEEKKYDYKKPEVINGAGHFTQLVWKNTKYIGAFSKVREDGKTVVVVKYSPGGNVRGHFAKNVFPPGKPITMKTTNMTPTPTTGNATFGNLTTPEPKQEVIAGATSLKDWRGVYCAIQWLFVGFLITVLDILR